MLYECRRSLAITRRAFTLPELTLALAGGVVVLSMLSVAIGSPAPAPSGAEALQPGNQPSTQPVQPVTPKRRKTKPEPAANPITNSFNSARAGARQIKDQTQIRGITQALVTFSGNNGDMFPMPSDLDKQNATLPDIGRAKDTTAHVFSVLISQGFVPSEMYISPAETNPHIKDMKDYLFSKPKTAVRPIDALWDPAFSADFTEGKTGNISYASMAFTGARRELWKNDGKRTPIVGNRGPHLSGVTYAADGTPEPTLDPATSNTLAIHGPPETWEGNIGYGDNSAEYLPSMFDPAVTYTAGGVKHPDVFFFDESDDASHTNAYLVITTKAGPKDEDFKMIWD